MACDGHSCDFVRAQGIASAYLALCLIGLFAALAAVVACAFLALDAISDKWPIPALPAGTFALITLGLALIFSLGALVIIGAGWPALRKKDCEASSRSSPSGTSGSCSEKVYKSFIGKETSNGGETTFGGGVGFGFECVGAIFALIAMVLVVVGNK